MPPEHRWPRRLRSWLKAGEWKDLLRDRERPWRTAFGAGAGALIGATPILGLHTWMAAGVGAVAPVPTFSVLAGSNVSNPVTFVPITFAEIRIGQLLLGRPQGLAYDGFSIETLGLYWLDAWVGYLVVGPILAVLTTTLVRIALTRRTR